ncbi:universal stress protein [Fulvivirgaceae bacterium BMA12]|uniref:Universal stress protein n=1 Tax=Agaribacillus aureus TaxID=3051825 RepID=A0ABT8LC73_9BACT|nr:universal stress protein [Fulvivirgaceae bacterium BMA12]
MYPLKKILVCLDLSEIDEQLISYTNLISSIVKAESIDFIHVAKMLDIPAEIKKEFPELVPSADETIIKRIESCLETRLDKQLGIDSNIILREGNPTHKIVEYTKENDIDLVVVGRKLKLTGTGIIPQKLVRLIPCNILFVPEKSELTISRIMVPVDFSKKSAYALERALDIARLKDIEILFQNVYIVPSGYSHTGKSYEEFADIMKHHAENDLKKFIGDFDLEGIKHRSTYTLDNDTRPADKIYAIALKEEASLIVVGAKGKTSAATVLLGSVTEQLANYDSEIPLFIVKDKKDNLSFFEALMQV